MSDRLDRIEAGLESTRQIVDSNARAILALTNQGVELNNKIDLINTELNDKIDLINTQLNNKLDRLATIVEVIANRYEDHEDRINRLERDN